MTRFLLDSSVSLAITRSRRGIVAAYLWWAVAVPTVILCFSMPWLPDGLRVDWFAGYGELMLLGLAAVASFWRAHFSRHAIIKRWWMLFSFALSIWYVASILGFYQLVGDGPLWSVLASDIGFGCYYLIVVIMLDQMVGKPHRITASVILVIALFGYIIVLPAIFAPEEYHSWIPSYLFYVSLDLYIFARVSLILRLVWRTRVGLDLAALWLIFAGILASDILDGLWNVGVLQLTSKSPLSVIFYLPLMPLLLITSPMWRLAWRRPKFVPIRKNTPDLERMVFWFLPLSLHLVGYGFNWLDQNLRNWRDGYLVLWLLVVIVFEAHRRWRVSGFDEKPLPLLPAAPEQAPITIEVPKDPLLQKLDCYLEAHLADTSLSLERLSDQLAMSPRQIQRRLKAATGLSPSQYLLEKRLARAADLLIAGNKSTYVAHATGFTQQSHFSRRFKERFGITPGQYASHRI